MSDRSEPLSELPSDEEQQDFVNVFPLSFAQQRMWFLDQLAPGTTVYCVPIAVQLSGHLDVTALTTTLNYLVERHETLRTTIMVIDGQPMQAAHNTGAIELPLVVLPDLAPDERAAYVRRLALEAVQQPFDLERGPLIRATLFQLTPTEHVLLLALHHIISDGWSVGVIVREVAACYAAIVAQQLPTLPPLPIQYADFAVWQREWMEGAGVEKLLTYWRNQLADAPPLLELPTDLPRPAVRTYHGAYHTFQIPAEQVKSLYELSYKAGTTPFMTLLAVFQILLLRYTGQHDLMVGTPIAGRRRVETEGLIGCFVNTLALRTDLTGNPSFRALLQRIRQVMLQAYAYQDLPFERLVAEIQPDRKTQATPLVQVFFVLQNAPLPALTLPGLTLRRMSIDTGMVPYELTLNMEEAGGKLWGRFEYHTDVFTADAIDRMAGHFQTLLVAALANPDQHISDIPLLTEAERERLLIVWNRTEARVQPVCLHQLVAAQAERSPSAVAVVYDDQRLSYAALNRHANQLAHELRRLGVRSGDRVGVCLARSVELIVALLGILKVGAAYVPLDPSYPAERLAFMLNDAEVALLISQQRLNLVLPARATPILLIDVEWERIAQGSAETVRWDVSPEQAAYVIYTSGSTGRPKGVSCHHAGVINLLADFARRQPIQPGDACSWWSSISFDVSVYEIWSALVAGGELHLVPERVRADAAAFCDWLDTRHIRSAYVPPFLIHDLANWLDHPAQRSSLRRLLVGVEPIPEPLLASIRTRIPGLEIINGYGPTETTICATLYCVPDAPPQRSTPIGRPVQNMQIYLLDALLQPVPIGVPGDVYIGGRGLAHGYLNQPALTAERFIPNPFETGRAESDYGLAESESLSAPGAKPFAPGSRLYHTGDRARYLPNGDLMFLGRTDQQVKIRGFRIELEEIEAVLQQHPQVRECVVLVREATTGDKRLVAYVVGEGTENREPRVASREPANKATGQQVAGIQSLGSNPQTVGPADLRSFLDVRLPGYMVPNSFVMLDALPLSPNGKVDHRALLAAASAPVDAERAFVAPRTPLEEQIARIWADVLGVEQVGVHDRFFEIGGHSLLATVLLARIRAVFDVDLPLRSLFDAPTIADVTGQIIAARQATVQRHTPPLLRADRSGPLPLSFAQQRLWLLHQFDPDSAGYIIPIALRLTGSLDVAALQHSLNTIVERHEALRTIFTVHEGEPAQAIMPALPLPLPLVDLRTEPKNQREQVAHQQIAAAAQQPFDLLRGPLLRTTLLRLRDSEHVLLLMIHHIIADGWSAGVLVRELTVCYTAEIAGQPPHLPDLPIQYADYAIWQRAWLQGAALDAQRDYWRTQLGGGMPMLELPTDYPRPASRSFYGAQQSLVLSPQLSADLTALSQREQVTVFMTLLAAFKTLLYRYTIQEDVVVGSPIANRTTPEIEPLIGFFVNMLALRTDLSGNPTFRDLLARVREVCLEAYAHQDLPFEQVVEAVQPWRSVSPTPLFTVVFALQNATLPPINLPDLVAQPLAIDNKTAKYDLTCTMMDTRSGLLAILEYDTDLFESTTIVGMLEHFQTLLYGIIVNPDQRLADLPLMSEAEQRLLEDWGNT